MKKNKSIIVLALLLTAIVIRHTLPQAKYVGTNFISGLDVPLAFSTWKGKDVSAALNIRSANTNFNFINDALAYQYVNGNKNLLLIILDAGNFHHPKVCFTGAGYKITELPDSELHLAGRSLKVHTLFTVKNEESFLSLYWIIIDKKVAHDWIEQKFKQLYYSMFNKKRVGLMVRLDIPSREDNVENSLLLAREFFFDLNHSLSSEQADYIFGTK